MNILAVKPIFLNLDLLYREKYYVQLDNELSSVIYELIMNTAKEIVKWTLSLTNAHYEYNS